MIKECYTTIIFVIYSTLSFAQTDSISTHLLNCEVATIVDTTMPAIAFHNSKNQLYLSKGWSGKMYGEIPSFILTKSLDSSNNIITIRGNQAFDVFPKGKYFEHLKKVNSIHTEFQHLGCIFLLFQKEDNPNVFELIYHINSGNSDENNSWIWRFSLYLDSIEKTEDILCELNLIITQVVKEYQN